MGEGEIKMKCKNHPKYEGLREPRKTKKYPEGCAKCWEIYFKRVQAGLDRMEIKRSGMIY